MTFRELNLNDSLLEGIDAIGYIEATPVQAQVIPSILNGQDVLASAQTGTGKTAAFLLPIIHKLLTEPHDEHKINCIIIVPTRELALQISQTMEGLGYFTDISCMPVYGGGDGPAFATEKKALSTGVDMVVCTPGRMIAHINMGHVDLSSVRYLILDEADRMLDMGFYDDINKIISKLPAKRQNLMFSATMPFRIRELARNILHNPFELNIAISKPPEKINQQAFIVYEQQKMPLIKYVLKSKDFGSIIVFCSKKHIVKELAADLRRARFSVEEIHSDLEQSRREQVLLDFKNKKTKIVVATDILSRGIDIEDIDLVINFDVPNDGEDYVHRIGRTARAATDGTAYTFVTEFEQRKFHLIEKLLEKEVPKATVPEQFGPTPVYDPSDRRKRDRPSGQKSSARRGGQNKNNKHRRNRPRKPDNNQPAPGRAGNPG